MKEYKHKVNFLYKSCLHKKLFRTLEFAKQKAIELSKKYEKSYYVYMCPICLNYHITTHKLKNKKYEFEREYK